MSEIGIETAVYLAPVCRILILQQIKLEKNGFQCLKERQISTHTHTPTPEFCPNHTLIRYSAHG